MTPPDEVDVIVVDDVPGAASDYARIVMSATGFTAVAFEDPQQALDFVKSHKAKIAILDQRLDGKTPSKGTELFQLLRSIDPSIRGVMLTALASNTEVGSAVGGFGAYLEKTELPKLPQIIVSQYALYQQDVAAAALATQQPIVMTRRKGLRTKAVFRLVDLRLIDNDFVDESEWTPIVTLHAGQRQTIARHREAQVKATLEMETTTKLTSEIGLSSKNISGLTAKLASEIAAREKSTFEHTVVSSVSTEIEYELPAEPPDPHTLHVALRRIAEAPVYKRVRVNLAASCDCCGLRNLVSLDLRLPTGKRAMRREDRRSDGTVVFSDLGIE